MLPPETPRQERLAFFFLSIVLAPVLAVILVGGYGLIIWIMQMLSGPPHA